MDDQDSSREVAVKTCDEAMARHLESAKRRREVIIGPGSDEDGAPIRRFSNDNAPR